VVLEEKRAGGKNEVVKTGARVFLEARVGATTILAALEFYFLHYQATCKPPEEDRQREM